MDFEPPLHNFVIGAWMATNLTRNHSRRSGLTSRQIILAEKARDSVRGKQNSNVPWVLFRRDAVRLPHSGERLPT
jgi:hypothetical protein